MGLYEWVKSKTGVWGPALLDYYFRQAWWINTIVVLYGLILLLAWQNLSRMRDELIGQILKQAGARKAKKGGKLKRLFLSDLHLSWDSAMAASRFPFIAGGSGLSLRRTTLDNIQALVSDRDLIQHSTRQLKEMGIQLERGK